MSNLGLTIVALACLGAPAVTGASCSDSKERCSADQDSESQAFIQTNTARLQKVKRHGSTSDEDPKKKPETIAFYEPEDFAALQSLSLLQQLQVVLSEDDSVASVSFVSSGRSHEYRMVAVSAYSVDANISIWTGTGYEYMHPGKPRTFKSREEGRYASARINEDGSVSGVFEQENGQTIDVRPLDASDTQDPAYSLLAEHHGIGQAHVFSVTPPLDLALDPYDSYIREKLLQLKGADAATWKPERPSPEDEIKNMGKPCDGCSPTHGLKAQSEWGGVKWYPGCYSGDDVMHTLIVGFAIPPNVFSGGAKNNWPTVEKAKARWEEHLTKASYIYEKQMNIQLQLGDVKVAQQAGPRWAFVGCNGGDRVSEMLDRLEEASDAGELSPQQASWHGFVNCGQDHGLMGIAYVEVLCWYKNGYNTGANKWQAPTSWFVYAHELGHNFGGKHSFEEGQGKTGGVMDYGDGKLDGHYQFNTKYRKNEICKHLQSIGSCDRFVKGTQGPQPPPSPPPAGKPPAGGKPPSATPDDEDEDCPPGPPGADGIRGVPGPPGRAGPPGPPR